MNSLANSGNLFFDTTQYNRVIVDETIMHPADATALTILKILLALGFIAFYIKFLKSAYVKATDNHLLVSLKKSNNQIRLHKKGTFHLPLFNRIIQLTLTPCFIDFTFKDNEGLYFKELQRQDCTVTFSFKIKEDIESLYLAHKRFGIERLTTVELYTELFQTYLNGKVKASAITINKEEYVKQPQTLVNTIQDALDKDPYTTRLLESHEILDITTEVGNKDDVELLDSAQTSQV